MRRNAIARIIIYSLILMILIASLVSGIAAGTFAFRVDYDADTYTLGAGGVPARNIQDIEIEWASGRITIETADTDVISFQETGGKDASPMVYRLEGDKLRIQYQIPKVSFGFGITSGKELVITVPRDWQCVNLTVDAASADLTVNNLTADDVELNMASGDSQFTDCAINELGLDCASGEMYYVGTLNSLECDTASGKVTAVLDNIPRSIDFNGASADLELTLPADAGFTVEMDALSGSFHSDFETSRRNGSYICGNGACKIDVDGVSGSITIHKGDTHRPKFA